MAIDTRDKRASVIGVDLPVPRLEQNAAGTIAQSGRQFAALLYIGILAAAPAVLKGTLCLTEHVGFENRLFSVLPETRTFSVLAETRRFIVPTEPRLFTADCCEC